MSRHRPLDVAVLVEKFSQDLTVAAMAGVERATIDQGACATLNDGDLRCAIQAGIRRYLRNEVAKKQVRDR